LSLYANAFFRLAIINKDGKNKLHFR